MRVGIYLGFPPEGGGAYQYAFSLLTALASLPSGYKVVAAYSHSSWQEKLQAFDGILNTIHIREGLAESLIKTLLRFGLPLPFWHRLSTRCHPFTQRLLGQSCDLWIFPTQDVWTYAFPKPSLGVIHDLMHRYEAQFSEVSAFGLFSRRERHYRRICKYARGVLVDSEIGKKHVLESYGVLENKLFVLPYVAPSYMHQSREPVGIVERYRLPEKFFFYPAQFWSHKNHIRLIEALSSLQSDTPDIHLVLAGSKKNAYESVVRKIKELRLERKVRLLGYIPDEDIPWVYRRARALIMPTFFGPTNIPPLEAMLSGCPIAISNIYGMPDQVGDAALLFDPSSTEQIAKAMRRLATDDILCGTLRKAGLRRAQQWGQEQFNIRIREILDCMTTP